LYIVGVLTQSVHKPASVLGTNTHAPNHAHDRELLYNTGWPKKRPDICVTITARILHGAKFPLAHL